MVPVAPIPLLQRSCSVDREQINDLLDACGLGFAFSLLRFKCSSKDHIHTLVRLQNCSRGSHEGPTRHNVVAERLSAESRGLVNVSYMPSRAPALAESPLVSPSSWGADIVLVTIASPRQGPLSESHSPAEWGRRGMGSEAAGGAGDRLQMLSLVSGHLVGWSPLQLLQLQPQGGSEAAWDETLAAAQLGAFQGAEFPARTNQLGFFVFFPLGQRVVGIVSTWKILAGLPLIFNFK